MKLLHLFSNYKLTGPAAPALMLASELQKRGHTIVFAHAPLEKQQPGYVDEVAREYGLRTTTDFRIPKHFSFPAFRYDSRLIAKYIDDNEIDVVHCNLLNDHLTAAGALRHSKRKPPIVRTNHDAIPMPRRLRNLLLFPSRTSALIELSERALDTDIARFRMPHDRVFLCHSPIDVSRFDTQRELPDMRAKWNIPAGSFVIGIAARIQRRRRFHVLIEAVAEARKKLANLRLVIIGRGTEIEDVAVKPVKEHGLNDITTFAGYLRGDEYVAGLAALDAKVFLFPGTDGSCRAAREALCIGRPVIASPLGMLPEIVQDGVTGRVFDNTTENLAEIILELAANPAKVKEMGEAARKDALAKYDPAIIAENIENIYKKLLV